MSNYKVDREAWAKYSIFEQMGNIGSEVGRSIKWHRANNAKREQSAIDRALDLFDATIECLLPENPARAREVLIAREEYTKLFWADTFEEDADNIERYFMNYAIAARKESGAF